MCSSSIRACPSFWVHGRRGQPSTRNLITNYICLHGKGVRTGRTYIASIRIGNNIQTFIGEGLLKKKIYGVDVMWSRSVDRT